MRLWLLSHLDPNAIQLTLAPWRRWGEPGLLLFLIRYNLIFTHFWHLALTEPVGASSGGATSLTLMGPSDLTVPQAQILRGHFGCAFSTLREAEFPVLEPSSGLEPSPEITARPWAWLFQWKGGLLLRLVSDVSAGGWLPGKVSNTQFLPKQNKNQHMQLKLLKSGLLILKQTVLPAPNFKYFWPLDEQIFHYLH